MRILLSSITIVLLAGIGLSKAIVAATLTPAPIWESNTLMGPSRPAVELVKGSMTYDAETKKLSFRLGDKVVVMTRGSRTATINGKAITLPCAPKVLNGTTYIPLKHLYVGLGLEVKPVSKSRWIICLKTQCVPLEVPPQPE
ncbi:MAG: copper amine oxidase N-terminal domain-containing protein [Candidatus Zipacnadales bacterium]